MGNTLRSTLGNMCGAEASKDAAVDDENRPVEKPKESKKEKKKNKKSKKEKNGTLKNIEEEENVEEKENAETEKENRASEKEDSVKKTDVVDVSPAQGSVYDAADETSQSPKAFSLLEDSTTSPSVATSQSVASDVESSVKTENVSQSSADASLKAKAEYESSESLKINSESRTESFTDEERDKKIHFIHEIETISPEELGVTYADDIFLHCSDTYAPFAEDCCMFHLAVEEFETAVTQDKPGHDFERCWEVYAEMLAGESINQPSRPSADGKNVDICDLNVRVQSMRANGLTLLDTIDRVCPDLDKLVLEAGTVDVIEYVKGKMVEGEQLGITSKFSAPGKYRRNMAKLRKALKNIRHVERETKLILSLSEKENDDDVDDVDDVEPVAAPRQIVNDDESVILPVEQQDDHAERDIFSELEKEPPATKPNENLTNQDETSNAPVETKTIEIEEPIKKSADKPERPDSLTKTYIIENIPEKSRVDEPPTATVSVTTRSVDLDPTSSTKDTVNEVVVEDEEHNTLDFGKYCFVDPSTGDIQVMRNRSKSLDSLVSMTSNRSSMSRFGSFEFVTGYEIVIAEKNQQSAATKQ